MMACRGDEVSKPNVASTNVPATHSPSTNNASTQITSTNPAVASRASIEFSEAEIKAELLVRLTSFFRWPEKESTDTHQPFRIGVLGKSPFGSYLNKSAKSTTSQTRAFQIVYGSKPEQLRGCHVVFIASEPPPDWVEIRKEWVSKPVLLMGDHPDFIEQGGMVHLLIRDQRPFLRIKRRAIEASGIRATSLLDNTRRIEWVP